MKDPFAHFPVLHAGDLILRDIKDSDIDKVHEFSYYNGEKTKSRAETVEALERIRNDYNNRQAIHWGITRSDDNTIIGTCGYYRGFENRSGEIGYVMAEAWRGKGIMKKAVRAAIDFGFAALKLDEIKAYTKPDNTASINVLLQAGFVLTESEVEDYIKFVLKRAH